jgi:hypothetical protein
MGRTFIVTLWSRKPVFSRSVTVAARKETHTPAAGGRTPAGGDRMQVEWSATTPETRRVGATMYTDFSELEERFATLRSLGEGYLEVWLPTEGSSQVTLGFRGGRAVVEQLRSLDEDPKSFLLVGDGRVPWDGTVDVPVLDEDAGFTGHFVMSVERAWDAVREFVRTGSAAGLGEWFEL